MLYFFRNYSKLDITYNFPKTTPKNTIPKKTNLSSISGWEQHILKNKREFRCSAENAQILNKQI